MKETDKVLQGFAVAPQGFAVAPHVSANKLVKELNYEDQQFQ